MNHVYRLIWSHRLNTWVAVSETTRARKKGGGRKLAAAALTLSCVVAHAAPGGGQVVAGSGQISTSGNTTTITQQSQNLSLNWQSFNIAPQQTVDFVQPSATAVAVNHIFDTNGTQILGHLNANGQVYLINPNGVLFGQGAVVNVGALVASSLNPTDANATTRSFSGTGTGSVVNDGTITAAPGGYVVLMGNHVSNTGTITARLGTVALAAGSGVTLSFDNDDLLSVQVDQSTLNTVAANGGLIQADGGRVIMTAGARDALLASTVNNTGVIEARTVEDHEGEITLLAGMSAGQVSVGGTLDASAPNGGDGGHIETSAAHVSVANDAVVTTAAARGLTGSWLIDPQDFTVAASGGDITGTTLSTDLATTNVTLQSSAGATAGSGNVNVNDAVTWSANTLLTLTASNNVNVNANITATGATAGLALNPNTTNNGEAASGTGVFTLTPGASITLSGANPSLSISGQAYTVINSLGAQGSTTGTDLQGIQGNLSGYYALGTDIDASATSGWNSGAGFTPIPSFSGDFNGLGHTIANLTINSGGTDVGLFGHVGVGATITNVGVVGANVSGNTKVGALAGGNYGTISNSYSTGSVSGVLYVGGLVGYNYGGTVSAAHSGATASSRNGAVGGLVGANYGNRGTGGTITDGYATGNVSGGAQNSFGGLVGQLGGGSISNSYATGTVTATGSGCSGLGGLVGVASSSNITNSYATGAVSGSVWVGGLIGKLVGEATATNVYATGSVSVGSNKGGGLVGANYGTVTNSYATGSVSVNGSEGGGLVGANYGTVTNSYATGLVSGSGTLGGLVAVNGTEGTVVTSSYWNTTTTGQSSSAAGTGLNTTQMTATSNFAGFNFTATPGANGWVIVDTDGTLNNANGAAGGTYPMLASEYSTTITNAHQLQLMAMGLSANYVLGANIDATATGGTNDVWAGGSGFIPIGSSYFPLGIPFTGTLDGQGHTINGLTISDSSRDGMGLVGELSSTGSITNVGVTGVTVSGSGKVGGLVGANYGTVSNSYSTGTVSGSGRVGGLVGANYGTVSNSYSTGTVSGGYGVGGLVGSNYGSLSSVHSSATVSGSGTGVGGLVGSAGSNLNLNSSISNSYATGTVTGSSSSSVGGLVGGTYGGSITDSYATGAVSGNVMVGGLIGQIGQLTTVSNVYATGTVSVGSNQGGGLVGANYGTLTNSYATGSVSGLGSLGGLVATNGGTVNNGYWDTATTHQTSSAAGTGLPTPQMQQQNTFSGWDFTGTWTIYDGNTYPLLRTFLTPLTVTANAATKTYDGKAYSGGNGVTYSVTPNGNLLGTLSFGDAVNAGSYSITPQGLYSNQQGYLINYVSGTLTVNPKPLTINGTSVADKVYDGTIAASLSGGTLSGVIGSDVVTLTQSGTFASANVGTGIAVNTSDGLGGAAAGNYVLTQPTGLSANITPATLSVAGTGVGNKVYDGTTAASLSGGTLSGVIGSDLVTLAQSGTFAAANVGTGVAVTASDSLGGAAAGNYTLTQPTGLSANITPATLTYIATPEIETTGKKPSGLTGTVSGFVAGDTLTNSTSGSLVWTTNATASSLAGDYAIDGSGLTAKNYVFVQDSANMFALDEFFPLAPSLPAVAGLESVVLPTGFSNSPLPVMSSLVASDNTLYLDGKGDLVVEEQGVRLPPQAPGTY